MQGNISPTIVVLGSINMDLVGVTSRMPLPGETIIGEQFFTAHGGKGANQAVAAARLGANVRMVGRVGGDSFGGQLLDGLRGYGIDVSGVAVDEERASGIAIILVDASGQNEIVAIYGANEACNNDQLEAAKKAMEGADALMLQLETPLELSLDAARYAKSKGIKVIWDPAPARELPDEAFTVADVLTPNQSEAEALTGIEVNDVESAENAANALLEKSLSVAAVKLGEDGVVFATEGNYQHIPAYEVDVLDTVAAGDAFGAGLAVALSEGKELHEAFRFASAAGAMVVTRQGAQQAMPSRAEVDELLNQ